MKFTLIGAIALSAATASAAHAESGYCEKMGMFAEAVMVNRQNQVPLSSAMAPTYDAEADGWRFRKIILAAYMQPAYRTQDFQTMEIANFRNLVEVECYKAGQ